MTDETKTTQKRSVSGGVRGHVEELWKSTANILMGIVPIVVVLLALNRLVLRSPLENSREVAVGIALSSVGLVLFVHGLKLGIMPLGQTVGINLPKQGSLGVVLLFGFMIGYGVTIAEPALHALGFQVEELSAGLLTKQVVVHTVALGVALGVTVGLLKIVLHIPITVVLIPAFLLTSVLAYFSPPLIAGVAFDAGGVTTGPVTVPIIIALGVGVASSLGGRDPLLDGFGLIALSSVGPIITLLLLGKILRL